MSSLFYFVTLWLHNLDWQLYYIICLLQTFAEKDSRQGGIVQLALQAYKEAKEPAEAEVAWLSDNLIGINI